MNKPHNEVNTRHKEVTTRHNEEFNSLVYFTLYKIFT